MIAARRLLRADVVGGEPQPDETDESLGESYDEDLDEAQEDLEGDGIEQITYAPQPEVPVSDRTHDRAVILIATLIAVGAMVLILLLNLFTAAGFFGSVCTTHLRSAQCYSPAQERGDNTYPGSVYPGSRYSITVP